MGEKQFVNTENKGASVLLEEIDRNHTLVQGAELWCLQGSQAAYAFVSNQDGTKINGKQVVTIKDTIVNGDFGECKKYKNPNNQCKDYMDLKKEWINLEVSYNGPATTNNKNHATLNHMLLCEKKGVILPVNSGQGEPMRRRILKPDEEKDLGITIDAYALFWLRIGRSIRYLAGKNDLIYAYGGDPINLNTGNFYHEVEDLHIQGSMPLILQRSYNSLDDDKKRRRGVLGEGWNHNYEMSLSFPSREEVIITLEDGREEVYRKGVNHTYVSIHGNIPTLEKEEGGFVYKAKELIYTFNEEGELLRKENKEGGKVDCLRDSLGRLEALVNSSGEKITFQYNEKGKLLQIQDHTGRRVCYQYGYGMLLSYTTVEGNTFHYRYNEDMKMNAILLPDNRPWVYNEYDSIGRVRKQTSSGGEVMELYYDDEEGKTYLQDSKGEMTLYERDEKFRHVATIRGDEKEQFLYNEQNIRSGYIDGEGRKTTYSYNEEGKLLEVKDALGQTTTFHYDEKGRLLEMELPGNRRMKNTYNDKDEIIAFTNAQGHTTKMEYDSHGYVTKVERPDGTILESVYDEKKNLILLKTNEGKKGSFVYDTLNRLVLSEDFRGRKTRYAYTAFDKLSRIERGDKSFQEMEYNALRKLIKIRDYDGECLTMDYDERGNLSQVRDKEGKVYKIDYNDSDQIERTVGPNGASTQYAYDQKGRLLKITNPLGGTMGYVYDKGGNIKTIQMGEDRIDIQQDPIGRITNITSPWGENITFSYNSQGLLEQARTKEGILFTKQYNAMGEVIEIKESNGKERQYIYNSNGNITEIKDNVKGDFHYTYQHGYVIHGEHNGYEEDYTYDENHNLIKKRNGEGEWEEYAYDPWNRLLWKKDYAGKEVHYEYDVLGRIKEVRFTNGNFSNEKRKQYAYSPMGNLLGVKEENGREMAYTYDFAGRLKTLAYGGENQTKVLRTYTYDQGGNPIKIQDSRGKEERYTYDNRGRILRYTDREGYGVTYSYEKMHRIKEKIFSDGRRAELSYNEKGQLTKLKDWTGTTVIERDAQGRICSVTNPEGKTVSYAYGAFGERTAILYPDRQKVTYTYGKPFQVQSIEREHVRVEFLYDSYGRVIQRKNANGITTSYTYDSKGRILTLKNEERGALLDSFVYTYDAYGNKTMEERFREGLPQENGRYTYTYDPDHQLLQVQREKEILCAYAYDRFGNRIYSQCYGVESRYVYNEEQELIREEGDQGVFDYIYDKRGNLRKILKDGTVYTEYTFDCTNRMVGALSKKGRASYRYNALGFRVGREEWAGKEGVMKKSEYILDMTRGYHSLLQKQEETGIETYIWGRELMGCEKDGHFLYYHGNKNQSILRITWEETGNTYERYAYGEFGERPYENQKRSQPFGYTSYEEDPISETYFGQNREYLARKGRFISRDMVGGNLQNPLTLNPYLYCRNRPFYYVDFDGRKPVSTTEMKKSVLPQAGIENYITEEASLLPQVEEEPNITEEPETNNGGIDGYIDPQIGEYPNLPNDEEGKGHDITDTLEEENCALSPEAIILLYILEGYYSSKKYSSLNNGEDTLGIGHDFSEGNHTSCCQAFQDRNFISWDDAVTLFYEDIEKNLPDEKILNLFPLDPHKRDALISLAFNTPEKFDNPDGSFYKLLINGNYTPEQVMDEFLSYVKTGSVIKAGIIKRRISEFLMFNNGAYISSIQDRVCNPFN